MKADDLKRVLNSHAEWLAGKGGKKADLRWADLRGISLREADLRWAELSDAKLSGADLRWANLRGSSLRCADLSNADLRGSSLREADLSNADLRWANLRGSSLRCADLLRVDLRDANLSGADLRWAELSWADLSGAKGIIYAQCAFSAHGECGRQLTGVLIDGKIRLFCGCFSGSLADLDAYIEAGEEKYKATRKLARDFIVAAIDAAREGGAS